MGNLFNEDGNGAAAQIAGLLYVRQDDDEPDEVGIYAMTARVPVSLASLVTVMAENAGVSRNEMLKLLLKAGIDDSLSRLPADLQHEIRDTAHDRITDFI